MLELRRWTITRATFILGTILVASASFPRAVSAQSTRPDASAWTVASQPQAIFGQSESELGGEFAGIVDAVRASGGTIIVADDQLSSITFFSPDGTLIATKGRQGEGPGEFSRISALVADSEGRLFVLDQGSEMGEMAQDTVGYYQFADAEVGDILARVPGTITSHFEFQGRGSLRHALLTPHSLGVARGRCLLVGTSDTPVLHVLDQTGAGQQDVRIYSLDRGRDIAPRPSLPGCEQAQAGGG